MKIKHTLFFLLIVGLLPACREESKSKREAKKAYKHAKKAVQVVKNDAPDFSMEDFKTAAADFGENVADFFEDKYETVKEGAIKVKDKVAEGAHKVKDTVVSWVSNDDLQQEEFPVVYFDFDKFDIRADQENTIEHLALQIRDALNEADKENREVTVVARGHSSPEKGSRKYNMLLSEKRAVALANELEKLGVSKDSIKVVGCGQEEPAVAGNDQHLNRRVEVRVISA